jgi:hypothetical protein
MASLLGGGRRSEYGHWPMPRTGLRRHCESCVPWTDDGDACECRILPWKRLSIGSLPFAQRAVLGCNALPSGQATVALVASRRSLEASLWKPVPVNL